MKIKNRCPLPCIDDLFNQVCGETIFSKIDLQAGYNQVTIKYEAIYKTTFRMRYGHYEFVVKTFWLTNTQASLTCLMNSILIKYLDKILIVLIDDILIYSNNE
jgi:hypothetical protein